MAARKYGRRRSGRSRGPPATWMGAPASRRRGGAAGVDGGGGTGTAAPESEKNEARPPEQNFKIRELEGRRRATGDGAVV